MATEKRLIDANAIIGKARWMEEPDGNGINCDILAVPVSTIEDAPTVDAVEVVRCEKCRYYEKAEYDEGYKMVCRLLKRQTASDGFCYCGERKANE